MVTKFYDLKELINEQLSRIEDRNLKITKEIHITHVRPDDEQDYYKVVIVGFNGDTVVV